MSATQSRFGAGALKTRATRSAGRGVSSDAMVVRFVWPRTGTDEAETAHQLADLVAADVDALAG